MLAVPLAVMVAVMLGALSSLPPLVPQSAAAWRYAAAAGGGSARVIYRETVGGLVCTKASQLEVVGTLERVAAQAGKHPARLAETILVYLWDDWTLLHVTGYDARTVLTETDDRALLKRFLERFYREHHVCLLGTLRVLVFGYERRYVLVGGSYVRSRDPLGERYDPFALEPKYFPGTGIFEPVGLVHAVKLSDLLLIGWLRERAIDLVTETLERRARAGSDPLKVRRE